MAGMAENYSQFDVRTMIRCFIVEGVTQLEIHGRLVNVYSQNEVSIWCYNFKFLL
jgi:hypothetical protein